MDFDTIKYDICAIAFDYGKEYSDSYVPNGNVIYLDCDAGIVKFAHLSDKKTACELLQKICNYLSRYFQNVEPIIVNNTEYCCKFNN